MAGPSLLREEELRRRSNLRRNLRIEREKQEKLKRYEQQLSTPMGEQIYRAKMRDDQISVDEEMGTKLNLSKLQQKKKEGAKERKRQRKEEEAAEGNTYAKRVHKPSASAAVKTMRLPRVQLNAMLEGICVDLHNVEGMGVFATPVGEREAPGYTAMIAQPMCLGDVLEKCHRFEYRNTDQFVQDVKLIHTNCEQWNRGRPTAFLIERSNQLVIEATAGVKGMPAKPKRLHMLYNMMAQNGAAHGATGNCHFDHREA